MELTTNINGIDNYRELLGLIKATFKANEEVVARFWKSKKGSGYAPICANQWKEDLCKKPCNDCLNKYYVSLNDDLLIKHMRGQHILGVYPLSQDNTCWFLAFDFDNHDGTRDPLRDVKAFYAVCEVQEIPCYVLRSKSGNGFHCYIFFEEAVPAWKARLVGDALLQEAQLTGEDDSGSAFDRMFPGQDVLTPEKPLGNLIALPFQGQAAKAGHTLILDPANSFEIPFPDQIQVLRKIVRVTEADLDRIIDFWGLVKYAVQAPKAKAKESQAKPYRPATHGKIPQGQRNNRLTSLAGSLRRRGLEYPQLKEALLVANEAQCSPPLPEGEVETIALSIAQYSPGSAQEGQLPDLASAKELVAGLPDKAQADPGVPFEPSNLKALAVIKENEHAEWAKLRARLKAANVSLRGLERAMNQARSQVNASNKGDATKHSGQAHPYRVNEGVLSLMKRGPDGDYLIPLCNFNARLVGERVYDDGAEQTAVFVIRGERQDGQPLPAVEVPAAQFVGMGWVTKHWGSQAVLNAGLGAKDHVRAAIQFLSTAVRREMVYAHIGWQKINGVWVYLHHGGGIGPDGLISGISVSLGYSRLKEYSLPEPPTGEGLKSAVQASLLLLRLVPARIAYPVLAGIYRAPLAEILPANFSKFLVGPSGTQKTELTAQMVAHYGAGFHGNNLPANWYATANAMEKMAFLVKDSLLPIDDFAPRGKITDVQAMHSQADRILRGAGNRSGRQRMGPDGSLRPEYYPRGLVVSSGEDLPRGHSLRGRMLVLEISPGDVNLETLTQVQGLAADGVLAQAMSGYLQWLASRFEELKRDLPDQQQAYRIKAREELHGTHPRTADIVASIAVGLYQFLTFAEAVGAITADEVKKHLEEGWNALIEAGRSQAQHQDSEDVVNQFLRLLTAAINSGAAHLVNTKDNGKPEGAGSWGWRVIGSAADPLGTRIGWIEGEVYLIPDVAFAVAQKLAQSQGTSLPVTQRTLWKRLAEKRYLVSAEPGRHTVRLMIAGKRHRVIHLDKTSLGGAGLEMEIPLPEDLQSKDHGTQTREWSGVNEFTDEEMMETVH